MFRVDGKVPSGSPIIHYFCQKMHVCLKKNRWSLKMLESTLSKLSIVVVVSMLAAVKLEVSQIVFLGLKMQII